MKEKNTNELWICTVKNGIQSFEIKNNELIPKRHFLKGYTITSTLQDNSGSFWFSTLTNGVFKLNLDKQKIFNKKSGLLDNRVTCIEVVNDSIWVGYNLNKLSLISKNEIKQIVYSVSSKTSAKAIYFDSGKNELMIAATDFLYNQKKGQIWVIKRNNFSNNYLSSANINANTITPDENGGYWIGGGAGFYHMKYNYIVFDSPKNKNFKIQVNATKLDKHKTVWLGCRDGLRSFKNGKLYYWGNDFEKLKYRVLDIIIDKDVLILATKGKGILFFDGKTVKQITKEDGLSSNMITSLALNNKQLWAGSLNGINKINILNNRPDDNNIEVQILTELSDFVINRS